MDLDSFVLNCNGATGTSGFDNLVEATGVIFPLETGYVNSNAIDIGLLQEEDVVAYRFKLYFIANYVNFFCSFGIDNNCRFTTN